MVDPEERRAGNLLEKVITFRFIYNYVENIAFYICVLRESNDASFVGDRVCKDLFGSCVNRPLGPREEIAVRKVGVLYVGSEEEEEASGRQKNVFVCPFLGVEVKNRTSMLETLNTSIFGGNYL